MHLTHEDIQQARRISRAIQDYFRINNKTEARSADVYEYIAKCNLIEKDRHRGLHFRKFLEKIKTAGMLKLIPQCTYQLTGSGRNEWYFYLVSDQRAELDDIKQTGKQADIVHLPVMREDKIEQLLIKERPNIERLPKSHRADLTLQKKGIRKDYPRAYEYWSAAEIDIMKRVFSSVRNISKVAELLQRQPHVIKEKLEELKILK